jgi:hypothetical protein
MSSLWEFVALAGGTTDQVLGYLDRHHWFFGFVVVGYMFYLHDKSLHARFDVLGWMKSESVLPAVADRQRYI